MIDMKSMLLLYLAVLKNESRFPSIASAIGYSGVKTFGMPLACAFINTALTVVYVIRIFR